MSRVSLNTIAIPAMSIMSDSGECGNHLEANEETPVQLKASPNSNSISEQKSFASPTGSEAGNATSVGANNISDSEEDDIQDAEPRFKYERLLSDRNDILFRDSATALAVHEKFLALGTKNGEIHVLDLMGNRSVISVPIPKHAGPVNDISISDAGDHMACAGEDGKVFVTGLYSAEDNFVIKHSEPVKAVAIYPNFASSSGSKSIIFGSKELVLSEKRFLGVKLSRLDSGTSWVTSVKWYGNMLAWGNISGVRVMCMKEKQVIGIIPRDQKESQFDFPNKCEICWLDSKTLLVSWTNVFHICSIRDRRRNSLTSLSSGGLAKLPNFELVINKLIHTKFAICGIGPYTDDEYVMLVYNASAKDDQRKVQLRVAQPRWEECDYPVKDIIGGLRSTPYATYEDYKLQSLPKDGVYFIVSPKDIVKAGPLDIDEIVDWHMERGQYEEALNVVGKDTRRKSRHNIRDISRKYLEYLLHKNQFEKAAKVCPKLLANDKLAWEEQIGEFYKAGKLLALAPYLPRTSDSQLSEAVYELVLGTYLQSDHEQFLQILREWPPNLYRVQAVINAVKDVFLRNPNNTTLLRALGLLYTFANQLESALSVYVKLKHKDVFELITSHRLYKVVAEKMLAVALVEIDPEQAVRFLTDNVDAIPIQSIFSQLQAKPVYLLQYLDRLFQKDKTIAKEYHDKQVQLYAEYDPTKLLHFMKNSKHFSLMKAFDICKKKDMIPEMVYLLNYMGEPKKALELILHRQEDISQAIEFCKKLNDIELYDILIKYSLDKPDFITVLLHNIGTHVDPSILIRQIKLGLSIPNLRNSLVRILQDYNLEITLREGCKKIIVNDCYQLLVKSLKLRQRGFSVDTESICHACKNTVFAADELDLGVTVFQCKHAFHTQCTISSGAGCPVCAPKHRNEPF